MTQNKENHLSVLFFWLVGIAFQWNVFIKNLDWNYSLAIFLLIILAIEIGIICFIYYKFGFEPTKIKMEKPEFEIPDLLPWQSDYLLNEGKLDKENTFWAYLLWLNYKQIISINNFQKLTINQQLPNILPGNFNQIIQNINQKGWKEVKNLKNCLTDANPNYLEEFIGEQLKPFYQVKPVLFSPNMFLFLSFFGPFLPFFLLIHGSFFYFMYKFVLKDNLQKTTSGEVKVMSNKELFLMIAGMIVFLLSFSVILPLLTISNIFPSLILIGFSFIILTPFYYFIWINWGKLNSNGNYYWKWSQKYHFYLQKTEKNKLNFANNSSEIQSYLLSVPFAAQFGFLDLTKNFEAGEIKE